jgi:hypothetical protein
VQEIDTQSYKHGYRKARHVKVATAAAYSAFNILSPGIGERKLVGNNAASQLTPDERKKFMTNNAHQKIDGGSLDEIKADPELINEVRDAVLKYASPEELREFASKLRVAGNAEAAYDLKELADQREGR